MIDHVPSLAGGDSQNLHEMGSLRDAASGVKLEPDENTLNPLKIMSHDIRSSLLSMLATLKLLNRGYYGKMDQEVANKIKDLLSSATQLIRIAEAYSRGTFLGNEDVEIAAPNRVMEPCKGSTPNKQVSVETTGNGLIP